jgi:hypothetical protein
MSKFEVAKAVKSLSFVHPGGKALGLGYPMDAEYLYASPGSVKIIAPVHKLTSCDSKTCYGEDWNRPMMKREYTAKLVILAAASGIKNANYLVLLKVVMTLR